MKILVKYRKMIGWTKCEEREAFLIGFSDNSCGAAKAHLMDDDGNIFDIERKSIVSGRFLEQESHE